MERKVHRGMKENIRKRKRKHPGRLAEGTDTNYQVLDSVPVSELSASDGGAVDEVMNSIPIVNAVNEEKLSSKNSVNQFLERSPKRKSKRVKDSIPKQSSDEVAYAKDNFEASEKFGRKYKRGVKPQQNLLNFEELSRKDGDAEEQDEEGDDAVMAFRAELADLPLSKVREVKERLGLKLFNKAYFEQVSMRKRKKLGRRNSKKRTSASVNIVQRR
ncbi:hypothetical protein KIN20_037130 [Parelaphostrongylus tenuis]|uniref:Uncharacterized protein n=1 Tax=Parelaphostrongylus tenuis TaxID=148309 RepID=A0AAD5RDY7_PARTN|nr:hypothetical protein KIN20_037130 [Parelaphostrongylus tenuis]